MNGVDIYYGPVKPLQWEKREQGRAGKLSSREKAKILGNLSADRLLFVGK